MCVCSAQDGKVRLYSIQGNSLKDEGRTLDATGRVTAMAFSNDGAHLAVTDEKKVLRIFTVADDYTVRWLSLNWLFYFYLFIYLF